jgi:glycerophosphoryl diester phosphodiesterase
MVTTLHAKGYAASAPYASAAWRTKPIFIQSFEAGSLRRFAALTPVPLALLLDQAPAPDSGLAFRELVSDQSLAELSKFVTVMAPWKALLYTLEDQQQPQQQGPAATAAASSNGSGLVLPGTTASTNSSRRPQSTVEPSSDGSDSSSSSGFLHPDVPLTAAAARSLQQTQTLRSTGLAGRLHKQGFLVHTYTLRDEGQFVLPTCQQAIACEFEWLFGSEHLDGAFADYPGTLVRWLQQRAG